MSKSLSAQKRLARWFSGAQRVLPWRDMPTPYRVWVSEIMLQQTQVIAVLPYFERFLDRFPTLESLARAPQEAVVEAWAGLGYYSRARNLHAAAQRIMAQGGSVRGFPTTREGWEALPGVGPYTAGAILSIAFDAIEAIVDGNVERVFARYFGLRRRELGEARYREALWEHARGWVEASARESISPSHCNQALMELGALTCSPRAPQCVRCPLSQSCVAHANHMTDQLPEKKAPKQWIEVRESATLLVNPRGEVLMRLAQPGEWRAGLWDLPLEQAMESASFARTVSKLPALGEIKSRAVVTRHRVSRTTRVVLLNADQARGLELGRAGGEWRWFSEPPRAVGSAFKKTWLALVATFPGVPLQTAVLASESSRSRSRD